MSSNPAGVLVKFSLDKEDYLRDLQTLRADTVKEMKGITVPLLFDETQVSSALRTVLDNLKNRYSLDVQVNFVTPDGKGAFNPASGTSATSSTSFNQPGIPPSVSVGSVPPPPMPTSAVAPIWNVPSSVLGPVASQTGAASMAALENLAQSALTTGGLSAQGAVYGGFAKSKFDSQEPEGVLEAIRIGTKGQKVQQKMQAAALGEESGFIKAYDSYDLTEAKAGGQVGVVNHLKKRVQTLIDTGASDTEIVSANKDLLAATNKLTAQYEALADQAAIAKADAEGPEAKARTAGEIADKYQKRGFPDLEKRFRAQQISAEKTLRNQSANPEAGGEEEDGKQPWYNPNMPFGKLFMAHTALQAIGTTYNAFTQRQNAEAGARTGEDFINADLQQYQTMSSSVYGLPGMFRQFFDQGADDGNLKNFVTGGKGKYHPWNTQAEITKTLTDADIGNEHAKYVLDREQGFQRFGEQKNVEMAQGEYAKGYASIEASTNEQRRSLEQRRREVIDKDPEIQRLIGKLQEVQDDPDAAAGINKQISDLRGTILKKVSPQFANEENSINESERIARAKLGTEFASEQRSGLVGLEATALRGAGADFLAGVKEFVEANHEQIVKMDEMIANLQKNIASLAPGPERDQKHQDLERLEQQRSMLQQQGQTGVEAMNQSLHRRTMDVQSEVAATEMRNQWKDRAASMIEIEAKRRDETLAANGNQEAINAATLSAAANVGALIHSALAKPAILGDAASIHDRIQMSALQHPNNDVTIMQMMERRQQLLATLTGPMPSHGLRYDESKGAYSTSPITIQTTGAVSVHAVAPIPIPTTSTYSRDHDLNPGSSAFDHQGSKPDSITPLSPSNMPSYPLNPTPLPRYAGGTDSHSGGEAMVGEDGPEMVILPAGTKVIPSDKTAEIRRLRGLADASDARQRQFQLQKLDDMTAQLSSYNEVSGVETSVGGMANMPGWAENGAQRLINYDSPGQIGFRLLTGQTSKQEEAGRQRAGNILRYYEHRTAQKKEEDDRYNAYKDSQHQAVADNATLSYPGRLNDHDYQKKNDADGLVETSPGVWVTKAQADRKYPRKHGSLGNDIFPDLSFGNGNGGMFHLFDSKRHLEDVSGYDTGHGAGGTSPWEIRHRHEVEKQLQDQISHASGKEKSLLEHRLSRLTDLDEKQKHHAAITAPNLHGSSGREVGNEMLAKIISDSFKNAVSTIPHIAVIPGS